MKPQKPTTKPLFLAAIMLAGVTFTTTSVLAVDGTWDGGGNSAIWGGYNNWNPNGQIANGVDGTAFFGTAFPNGHSITVNTNRTVGHITFTDPGTTDLILATHANNYTLTLNVSSGTPLVDVTQSDRTLTINPRIAGNDGLAKIGPGNLTLTNANLFSGFTTVSAGTLTLANSNAIQNSVLDTAGCITGDATNGLKTTVPTLTLGGLAGDKNLSSLFITTSGGYDTVTSLTLNPGAGVSASYSGIIADGTAGMTLTKTGDGTQTIGGASYTGDTAITAGTLEFATGSSSATDITVAASATSGVLVATDDGQWANTGNLTQDASSAIIIDYGGTTPSTTVAPIRVDNLSLGTDLTLTTTLDSPPLLLAGQSYPLVTWTTSGPADVSAFTTLNLAHRVAGNLSVVGNTLYLNITSNAAGPISWSTGDGDWDTVTTNWLDIESASTTYFDALDAVVFGDAAGVTGNPTITLASPLSPVSVTMNSTSHDYSITGTGAISGTASLTLDAANSRTLGMATYSNNYSGDTTINGGTLKLLDYDVIPDGAGKGNLVVNGSGVFDLNAQTSETINGLSGSGTVDTVAGGTPTFTVGGNNASSTFGGVIQNTAGTLILAKTGTGTLILSGTNTYSGGTNITSGTLQVGDGGTSGTLGSGAIATSGTLAFNRSDALAVSDVISGSGAVIQSGGGTVTLSGENTYTGLTTVTAGTMRLTGNRSVELAGTVDVGGTSAVLEIAGDLPLGTSQLRPGNATGTGTVNQTAGALTCTGGNQLTLGTNSATQGFYNLSGGTFTTAGTSVNRGVIIGVNADCDGTFTLSGTGVLDVVSGSSMQVCRSENANGSGGTGVFNQTGGAATVSELRIGGSFAANNAGETATLNFTAGTFAATSFTALSGGDGSVSTIHISGTAEVTLPAFPTTRGTGATATITFDGGTLKNGAASPTFIEGLTDALIKAGGATFDTTAGDATISQDLLEDSGSTGGGLTKTGTNALTLAGANTYTGPTLVSGGTLKFSTAGSVMSDITVAGSAGGGVLVAANDGQFSSSGGLTYDNNSILVVDYGSTTPSTTVAPLQVANLVLGSNLGLELEGDLSGLVVSQTYPLVTWTTSGPSNGTAFTAVVTQRLSGNFSVVGNTLSFTVTSNAPGGISWNTGNGAWDTVTSNWLDSNLASTTYFDPVDTVLFGDAGGVSGNPVITLNSNFAPVSMTMNSTSHDYTITGTGSIGGTGSLTLDAANTQTLTLATANTYTGATIIDGGTLQLGSGGADGSLDPGSAISLASGATFAVNQSDTVIQGTDFSSAPLAGAGGFTQTGGGTTILNAVNTYTGSTVVSGGSLQATVNTSGNGVGTSAVFIGSGSVLLLDNTNTTSSSTVTASNTFTGTGLLKVQFAESTNPRNLQMPNVSGFDGTIQLSSLGTTGDKWNALGVGTTAASLIVDADNTLYVPTGTNPAFTGGITLNGTGNSEGRGAIRLSNGTLGGNISLAGDTTINLDNAAAILAGDISSGAAGSQTLTLGATASTGGTLSGVIGGGTGTLNVATAVGGTYTLTNANTYTGNTTINAGILQLGNVSALGGNNPGVDGTSGITMAPGTTLRSTLDGAVVNAPITIGTTGTTATISAPTNAPGGGVVSTLTLNGAISGDGDVTFTSSVNQNAASTVLLNAQSTYAGKTLIDTSGTTATQVYVNLGIADALPPTTVLNLDGGNGTGSGRTLQLDMNGFDQTLAGLTNVVRLARNQRVTNSGAPATLTVNNSVDYSFGGSTTFTYSGSLRTTMARIQGAISLVKSGAGTFTLVETHTYTGDTTVNEGILRLGGDNTANDSSTVTIAASGATLDLTYAGTDTVGKLFIGTTQMPPGVYGLSAINIPQITGTGTLTVGPGFSSWITGTFANGTIPGDKQGPNDDADNDGISNLMEYAIDGQDPTVPNPAIGSFSGNTLSFTKRAGTSGLTYAIQESTDLGVSDVWEEVTGVSYVNDATTISYTLPGGPAKDFMRLQVVSSL